MHHVNLCPVGLYLIVRGKTLEINTSTDCFSGSADRQPVWYTTGDMDQCRKNGIQYNISVSSTVFS